MGLSASKTVPNPLGLVIPLPLASLASVNAMNNMNPPSPPAMPTVSRQSRPNAPPVPSTASSPSDTTTVSIESSQSTAPSVNAAPSQSEISSQSTTSSHSTTSSQTTSTTTTVEVSVNVSVTATLSPAGGISSTSHAEPLTAVAATTVAISSFLLIIVIGLVILFCYRRRRRQEEVERVRDSWAESGFLPDVTRASRSLSRRTSYMETAVGVDGLPPNLPPKNAFLRVYERASAIPTVPSVPSVALKTPGPHVEFEEKDRRGGYDNGDSNGSRRANMSVQRGPSQMPSPGDESPWPLVGLGILPQPTDPRDQTTKTLYGNPPRRQTSVRRPGVRNSDPAIRPEHLELPESLGRLNRWLDENRRRSQL